MTLPRTVGEVLADHVTFEVECIDRMYLNVYVPQLQYATGLVSYIHRQLGKPVASTAALAPVSEAFTKAVRAFAACRQIPWVDFARGQRKDDVAHEYLSGFGGEEGVVFVGKAQEKTAVFRTERRRSRNRPALSVDRARQRHGQQLLHLRCRPRFWSLLPQVLQLLPVQRQALPERPRICQASDSSGKALPLRRSTTAFSAAPILSACRRSATRFPPTRSTPFCASGCGCCRIPSPTPTVRPATAMTSRSCRRSSRPRRCSIGRCMAVCSLNR